MLSLSLSHTRTHTYTQIEAEAKLYMIPKFDEILEGYMAADDKDAVAGQIFEAVSAGEVRVKR